MLRQKFPKKRHSEPVRIVSGRFRGQSLAASGAPDTHPMGAREKLALFNMIAVENQVVLDAFAGTGALGFEALSRGAKKVIFVEKSPKNAKNIALTCQKLALPDSVFTIYNETVARFAARRELEGVFEVILADPPYDSLSKLPQPSQASGEPRSAKFADSQPAGQILDSKTQILAQIAALTQFLAPNGYFLLSSPAKFAPFAFPDLALCSTHTYAAARLTVYRRARRGDV